MNKKNRFFRRAVISQNPVGCDNAGNPLPSDDAEEVRDANGRVFAEVGRMEPEIQAELDRILKHIVIDVGRNTE